MPTSQRSAGNDFFRNAPKSMWPRLIVLEDARSAWTVDLFSLLASLGYVVVSRTRLNVMLRRIPSAVDSREGEDSLTSASMEWARHGSEHSSLCGRLCSCRQRVMPMAGDAGTTRRVWRGGQRVRPFAIPQ